MTRWGHVIQWGPAGGKEGCAVDTAERVSLQSRMMELGERSRSARTGGAMLVQRQSGGCRWGVGWGTRQWKGPRTGGVPVS